MMTGMVKVTGTEVGGTGIVEVKKIVGVEVGTGWAGWVAAFCTIRD